jgi:hypothetical protein
MPGILSEQAPVIRPSELTPRDYVIMLLNVAASIEHALMVQYLYAAYSLGGAQVPIRHRPMVERWRDIILTIAREEMGHLLTVQNLIFLLGGAPTLDREDYPFDTPFYPFQFRLEPLTVGSLACYTYAEMPAKWLTKHPTAEKRQLKSDMRRHLKSFGEEPGDWSVQRVGKLYEHIVTILRDRDLVPDSAFREDTLPYQASWDEWGRGYSGPKPSPSDPSGERHGPRARVLIQPMGTREAALTALHELAEQGEASSRHQQEAAGEPSHFHRFLGIYRQFRRHVVGKGWHPARAVAINPTERLAAREASGSKAGLRPDVIEHATSATWASLFNLRYRMLLTYLSHGFRLVRQPAYAAIPSARGAVMHRAFTEMYNLKTIAGILVRSPLTDDDKPSIGPRLAGPPFQMPYNLALPLDGVECWRLHHDLTLASDLIRNALLAMAEQSEHAYLMALGDLDRQTRSWIDQIMLGLPESRSAAE